MALDEPKTEDVVFQEKGFTFLVDPKLLDEIQPVKIDFIEVGHRSGFKIDSSLAQRSCGSGCSC
jgi:iron-sulfur cluster assembly protein